jgi:hypothetical protein
MTFKENILIEEGYLSAEKMLNEVYLLTTLSKKEQYNAEIEFFEKKYNMKFDEFEKQIHSKKGKENFRKEEDLEDWEFAISALKWWTEKAKELKNA